MNQDIKQCTWCREFQPLKSFYQRGIKQDCKNCCKAYKESLKEELPICNCSKCRKYIGKFTYRQQRHYLSKFNSYQQITQSDNPICQDDDLTDLQEYQLVSKQLDTQNNFVNHQGSMLEEQNQSTNDSYVQSPQEQFGYYVLGASQSSGFTPVPYCDTSDKSYYSPQNYFMNPLNLDF